MAISLGNCMDLGLRTPARGREELLAFFAYIVAKAPCERQGVTSTG